jgi:hypothetical protein
LSDAWKEKFRATREELNKYLDQLPAMRLSKDDEKPLTRREIRDLFLFGDLSHATWNPENRRKFKDSTAENWEKEFFTTQFVEILLVGLGAIQSVANQSKLELEMSGAGFVSLHLTCERFACGIFDHFSGSEFFSAPKQIPRPPQRQYRLLQLSRIQK